MYTVEISKSRKAYTRIGRERGYRTFKSVVRFAQYAATAFGGKVRVVGADGAVVARYGK